jgi:hypothetical protein
MLALFVTAALSACTTTDDQKAQIAKVYDATCSAFPPLYMTYVNVVSAKPNAEAKIAKAELIKNEVTALCENRPSDLLTASVALSAAYYRFNLLRQKS